MIRRSFLKIFGPAAIAFAVGVEHFKPIHAEAMQPLDPRKEEISRSLSPVLEGVREWNDKRLMGRGEVWDEDPRWISRETYTSRVGKLDTIRGGDVRERWLKEMTEMKKSGEFAKYADASAMPEHRDGWTIPKTGHRERGR